MEVEANGSACDEKREMPRTEDTDYEESLGLWNCGSWSSDLRRSRVPYRQRQLELAFSYSHISILMGMPDARHSIVSIHFPLV